MMPLNEFSDPAYPGTFSLPVKGAADLLDAWEMGGVALNDPSHGLLVKVWHAYADASGVWLEADGVPAFLFYPAAGITEIDLAFDQNMNPFLAFMQGGVPKIYWYDGTIPGYQLTTLPAGSHDLRCTLDEKRQFLADISDVLLFYVRGTKLYQRIQRDRYAVEYDMGTVPANAKVAYVAMAGNGRLDVGAWAV